jgi:hypothetical protein
VKIRNWERFQHYKHRKPPWIKLYRELLEDPDWMAQPDSAKALLMELWMVASDTDDGSLPDLNALAWRLRRNSNSLADALVSINAKFIVGASEALACCKQDAIPEKRREETEERGGREEAPTATAPLPNGKGLDEIPCPMCGKSGFLKQSAAKAGFDPGWWCRPSGGCGANLPLTHPQIWDSLTERARVALRPTLPQATKRKRSGGWDMPDAEQSDLEAKAAAWIDAREWPEFDGVQDIWDILDHMGDAAPSDELRPTVCSVLFARNPQLRQTS